MTAFRTRMSVTIFMSATALIFAQSASERVTLKKDFEIQKYTIMENFEETYVITPEKRAEMKLKRIENAEYTLSVLDTIKISNRKKNLLLRDLKYSPFSTRLNKFIVESKFENEFEEK